MQKQTSIYLAPIIASIGVLFLGFCIGSWFDLYTRFALFDKVVHFLGGGTIAFFFSRYYQSELHLFSNWNKVLVLVAFACFVGVFWEFAEYASSQLLPDYAPFIYKHFYIGTMGDTLGDLLADMLGGAVFAFFLLRQKQED